MLKLYFFSLLFLLIYGLEPGDYEFQKSVKENGIRSVKKDGVITKVQCKKVFVSLFADGKEYRRKKILGDRCDPYMRAQFVCKVIYFDQFNTITIHTFILII